LTSFSEAKEFSREFSRLLKKWKSLRTDLDLLKSVLGDNPRGYEPFVMRITGLKLKTEVYKVKHFRCAAMKGKGARSGIRIIYAYLPEQRRIDFIEIYYKEKDDKDCDRERIRKYYK
jgi:mRNA-degrading endonuclease RelE of RelBE toxin-antitoxin system